MESTPANPGVLPANPPAAGGIPPALASAFRDYRFDPERFDELFEAEGELRTVWKPLLGAPAMEGETRGGVGPRRERRADQQGGPEQGRGDSEGAFHAEGLPGVV